MRLPTSEEVATLEWLSALPNVKMGLYEVTNTQLQKGLVDANETIRNSFVATGLHDFSNQGIGQEFKRVLPVWVLNPNGLAKTKFSLYRSNTKTGAFFRFWIYRFCQILPNAHHGDLMAFVQDGCECLAYNLTLFELPEERKILIQSLFPPQDK